MTSSNIFIYNQEVLSTKLHFKKKKKHRTRLGKFLYSNCKRENVLMTIYNLVGHYQY